MNKSTDSFVVIKNLKKKFKDTEHNALNNLCAEIKTHRMTGLIGPDGAGKSTLLRLLADLLQPSEGEILITGLNSSNGNHDRYKMIGYMPQQFGLYEDLTVMQNLKLYADLKEVIGRKRKEKFEELLSFTNLSEFKDRLAGKLSGGMKQKLGLACALLGEPKLLLLDEPSVGVDPISRREFWLMVKKLQADGITVVWSTAYLDEAEKCDEVILLNSGEKIYGGSPSGLLKNLNNRTFLLENIEPSQRRLILKKVESSQYVMDSLIQGNSIRILSNKEVTNITNELLEIDDDILCRPVAPRFEDAFIDLLGGGVGDDVAFAKALTSKEKTKHDMIVTDSLTKNFGDFVAVKNINLQVKQGEIFGLLGPNGAGKSTTFYMLCGLLNPTLGSVKIDNEDLVSSLAMIKRKIGYMAQKFSLYGNLNVRQNLEFFSKIYGLRGKKRIEITNMIIKIFHLKEVLSQNANALPLGYKQRLALACAIMHSPKVLFLDEPTSGVDPVTRREFWNHINSLADNGSTVLVTTHFMDEAEYCDRITLLYRGQNIATGTPDELKKRVTSTSLINPSLDDAFVELVKNFHQEHSFDGTV